MRFSEENDKICAAMVRAYAAMKPVTKKTVNPHFKSKYADMAAIDYAVRTHLACESLCVIQGIANNEALGGLVMVTRLMHESTQWAEIDTPYVIDDSGSKYGPQQHGSAQAYARRYGLMAITGIAVQDADDDDGNAAQAPKKKTSARSKKKTTSTDTPTGPREIEAYSDGTCGLCKGVTVQGSKIMYNPATKGGSHPECYAMWKKGETVPSRAGEPDDPGTVNENEQKTQMPADPDLPY